MASLLNMSGRALIKMPYDAEIEYLESTGTQYIVLNIVPDFDTEVTLNACFTSKMEGVQMFGTRTGNSNESRFFVLANADEGGNKNRVVMNTTNVTYTATLGVFIEIKFNETNTHNCYINGQKLTTFTKGNTLIVNNALTAFGTSGYGDNHWCGRGRIKYAKVKHMGMLVAEYISVRKDGVGYLYDKVSKQLFGNAGTGNFILGPDK